MKAEEVVALLQARLPLFTDKFSDSSDITSITNPSADTALATTALDHELAIGNSILIKGSESDVAITSFTRTLTTGTIITTTDHDITNGLLTIETSGANEAEFNGTFTIKNVNNRREITVVIPDSGATTATGTVTVELYGYFD